MKKSVVYLALGVALVTSTSCMENAGSDKDKLAGLMTDTICMASDAFSSITDSANMNTSTMSAEDIQKKQDEITKKGADMEAKVKELPKTYGFADESAAEAAFKKLSDADKADLRTKVEGNAKSKCNPPAEMLNAGLDGFFKS